MAITRLKFDSPNKNIDEVSNNTNLRVIYDGYRDTSLSFRLRPGLIERLDLGTGSGILGQYYWDNKDRVIAVSNGRIFSYDRNYNKTELTGATLDTNGQVVFAEAKKTTAGSFQNENLLFMANGSRIVYTDNSAVNTTKMEGADDPVQSTHIWQIDGYLGSNDISSEELKSKWKHSPVNNQITFTGGTDYAAPMQPDNILAIVESKRRNYVFGTQTTEPWEDSGGTIPFTRINGALLNTGTYSKDSIAKFEDTIFFFTNKRKVARLDVYNLTIISTPYDKFIQDLDTIDDVVVFTMSSIDGLDLLVLSFPSENVTLAHNIGLYNATNGEINDWYELSYWNNNRRNQFLGINHVFAENWGVHLIGDRTTGKIYEVTPEALTDAGTTIKHTVKTGWINHGSDEDKLSVVLRLIFKSGEGKSGETSTAPSVWIRWRDDGNSDWGNKIALDLGKIGYRNYVKEIRPMGIYSSRQYEIIFGDQADYVLVRVEEEMELLGV